ncbi:MAG TPA: OmpA family protein [Cytophagaceae bacterium]|jgi:chemotaxis protein MotB|nr:OmpA family protein [Cytophagaceae bacterium]
MRKIIFVLSIALLTVACVSKKKFNDMAMKKSRLEAEKSNCEDTLKLAEAERNRLREQVAQLLSDNSKMQEDTLQKGENLRRINRDYEDLSNSFEKLLNKHNKLQNYSAMEADRLTKDLMKQEKELKDATRKSEELQASLNQREARVKELEKILADKDKAVHDLKTSVSNALLSFKDKDLTVHVKNGKVYVSLAEQLLFKSGSTEVDPGGVEALRNLASVLKEQKDVSVMVEGHTDDVPVAKGTPGMKDNWDLSVLRATSITRILTNHGADPKNILPAGRGQNSPIAEGKTAEARKKNRRTEIILTPKLDELFKVLETN